MENLGKKVGFLKGLMEGMNMEADGANGKLMAGIVDLLGELSDRVEVIDELLDDLNDYVESIDDDLMLTHDQVADAIPFVKENTNVTVRFFKGAPFSVQAPNFVELQVTNTEPGFKGDTAANTTKPATFETGLTLQVPLFIENGEVLKIDTRDGGMYLGRA